MNWFKKIKTNYISGMRASRSLALAEKILNCNLSSIEKNVFLEYCNKSGLPEALSDQQLVLMFFFDHIKGENGCPKMPKSNAIWTIDCLLSAIRSGILHTRPLETTEEMIDLINEWKNCI